MEGKVRSAWDREQDAISEKLKQLVLGTGYEIKQSNGQRVFAPCDESTKKITPPPKGAEIFVGNLPHDLFEDELIPLFSTVGPIYNLRLMLDFFGRNRGFIFITYYNVQHAHLAVINFNGFLIRKKTKIAVAISVDNRRLFVGNIPRDRTRDEVETVMNYYVQGIVDVIMYNEPYDITMNRGFVFIEFESHRAAAIARRQLAPGNLEMWGKAIYVDWAEPLPIVNPQVFEKVTKLYISNIPNDVSCAELRNILSNNLQNSNEIVKVYKMKNFAFVHFTLRKYAIDAYHSLQGRLCIRGVTLGVEWARPIEYSKKFQKQNYPDNHCRSVPPAIRKFMCNNNFHGQHTRKVSSNSSAEGSHNGSADSFNFEEKPQTSLDDWITESLRQELDNMRLF